MNVLTVKLDWVLDKEHCGYAFAGICWEKSFIPLDVWKAGESNTNIDEIVHPDINQEGMWCTLLGGLRKGQAYDSVKFKSLIAMEQSGVRPSYKSGHISENFMKNIKRKGLSSHRALESQDSKIVAHNERFLQKTAKFDVANGSLLAAYQTLDDINRLDDSEDEGAKRERLWKEIEKANKRYDKAKKEWRHQADIGERLL
ncbi:hypothetical protein DXG01_001199 [Tephrocybe rancida]|nr:hypothetical protein DXG01_001199 [Tephrocybe rancida]